MALLKGDVRLPSSGICRADSPSFTTECEVEIGLIKHALLDCADWLSGGCARQTKNVFQVPHRSSVVADPCDVVIFSETHVAWSETGHFATPAVHHAECSTTT